jgi:23S rRNA (adenine2503-C2)-methyltransferase
MKEMTKDFQNGKALFGQTQEELAALMAAMGEPKYRAAQVVDALYRLRIESLDEMTTLPLELRERLKAEGYSVGLPKLAQVFTSVDGTERYLVELADGQTVETVWMPDGDGGERGDGSEAASEEESDEPQPEQEPARFRRATICISSQVGCAVNCQFCLTAKLGLQRNLTAGEIAGQVVAVLNRHSVELASKRASKPERINLVFMGMGEPFLNYDAFMTSVRLLVGAVGIPESRMTVSTSGIVPAIRAFAKETIRPKLAVSLNASNNTTRLEIMPITKKWDIQELLAALKEMPLRTREGITFEYVLLGGVNDQPEHARELLQMLSESGLRAKINLIVWNPGPGIDYKQPKPEDVDRFQKRLIAAGVRTYIRRPRGRDIYAACGQLKRTVEETPLVTIG